VFFFTLKYAASSIPQIWPMTVAMAAPATPMSNTKMNTGSRMMLTIAPRPWVYMLSRERPVPCSSRSSMIWPNKAKEPPMTMCRYCSPITTISSTWVWERRNAPAQVRPSTQLTAKPTNARNRPFTATRSARCRSPAPNARPSSALTPTAVPAASEIIRFWAGKASDTAVSDASLTQLTNTLSTMLYSACTSMEAIMGRDMFQMSLETGMTPSLFSAMGEVPFCSVKCSVNNNDTTGKGEMQGGDRLPVILFRRGGRLCPP